MRYAIGLFGRAGKIEGVLCSETGLVLRQIADKTENVQPLLAALAAGMPLKQTAVYAGLDGETDFAAAEVQIKSTLSGKVKIKCENFAGAMLGSCFTEAEDGAVLHLHVTAGAAAQSGKAILYTGGDGAPLWSRGGSFFVSTEAIAAAFAASEPNGEETCLVRLLENAVGMPLADAGAFLKCAPPEKIASYAKIVRHGLRLGDGAAKEIMKNTLDALLAYLRTISAFFTKRVPLYVFDVPQ